MMLRAGRITSGGAILIKLIVGPMGAFVLCTEK